MRIIIYDRDRFYIIPGGGSALLIDVPGTWFLGDTDTVAVESGLVEPIGKADITVGEGGRAIWPYCICNEEGSVIADVHLIAAWTADVLTGVEWRVLIEFHEPFSRGLRLEIALPDYKWPLDELPIPEPEAPPVSRFDREGPL